MFKKFRKKQEVNKTIDQIQAEFDQEKVKYINAVNSDVFKFFKEYFEAKIEINRDQTGLLNPYNPLHKYEILKLNVKNEVMAEFITEMEEMAVTDQGLTR